MSTRTDAPGSGSVPGGETPAPTALGHRVRGLDGLRGLAVGAVLLFHGEIAWMRGGFLGISLFFTLSGFLITSMLLRSHADAGRTDLRSFWSRRYRRLLPAAYLTLAGIVVFGATVATEQQLADLPGAVASAIAQVTNWFFIATGQSYVAIFSAPSPVQHFWSLAIEEQFYLVMPLALILLLRFARSLKVVAGFLAAGAVASTLTMRLLFESGSSIDRLYYGTDTRAAELLVGALLAVVLHARPMPTTGRLQRAFPAIGVVCGAFLIWGFTHFTLSDPLLYRGGFLVVAIASAGLITSVLASRGPASAALSFGPIAALGVISYGVYLFHWPLFLWLTEARTGLGVWPLLALRVAVTVPLAIASFHLLEMPVRRGAWKNIPRGMRLAIPVGVAACILAGTIAVGRRDVHTDLAGLGVDTVAAPTAAARDGVLDVLVIADAGSADLGPALIQRSQGRNDLRVKVAAPFSCAGIDPKQPTMCTNWLSEWPKLIDEFDPDVVLFHVTDWPKDEIAALSKASDREAQINWTKAALNAGFDLLGAKGATILWSRDPTQEQFLRQMVETFYPAIVRVTSERADTRRRERRDEDVASILDDLELYRRRADNGAPRVMVVGDSIAKNVSYGLERWATHGDKAVVWSGATEGCGIADEGAAPDVSGRIRTVPEQCRGVVKDLASVVDQFRPDVVLVLSEIYDFQDRRLGGSSDLLGHGDRRWDDYLLREYIDAYDTLSSHGAHVIWMKPPCVRDRILGITKGAYDIERVRYVDRVILGRLADARPDVRFFDLFKVVCPGGAWVRDLGGITNIRPDGQHFSEAGSLWFARKYGQQLLDLGTH